MGNQNSSPTSESLFADRGLRPFTRHVGGSLGLSRAELDMRSAPSGLYNSCPWEDKAIRKLIADGKIAARLKGSEYRTTNAKHECPICFLYYTELNVTKCCNANICSECFLQVRPQKEKQPSCPFCNSAEFTVTVAQKPSEEELEARENDEQLVMEARIRAGRGAMTEESVTAKKKSAVAPESLSISGFGLELEKDERFQLLKKRSESFASNEGVRTPQKDAEIIQTIAMTPEERRRLEEEMRAQHSHPLALRVEAEAQERRLQNEQAYYRSNNAGSNAMRVQQAVDLFRTNGINGSAARRRLRHRSGRDWNQIVDSFERGGNGGVTSLDDLVVLEAAILLSMEEDARREREGDNLDSLRHAVSGFPLVRSFLGGSSSGNTPAPSAAAGATEASSTSNTTDNSIRADPRRSQVSRSTGYGGSSWISQMPSPAALDAANLIMRGITEEAQIAMAIAASLQETSASPITSNDSELDEGAGQDSSSSSDTILSSSSFGSNGNKADSQQVVAEDSLNESGRDQQDAENGGTSSCYEETTITELAQVVTDNGTGGEVTESPCLRENPSDGTPCHELSDPEHI